MVVLQQMDNVRRLSRYAPYALRLGLCALRIRPRYSQCFISSSRAPSIFVINGIRFEACHEINAFPREFFPPVVIGVATIHANHASWLVIEAFSHIDLMFFARSGKHEVRQICIVFEAKLLYTAPWFGAPCKRRLSQIYFWQEIGSEPTIMLFFVGQQCPRGNSRAS